MACCSACAKTGGRCGDTSSFTTDAGVAKIKDKPGVAAPATVFLTNTTAPATSSTSTYLVVGGAALALGVLGAMLYSRHR